jgi:hypothetical protein
MTAPIAARTGRSCGRTATTEQVEERLGKTVERSEKIVVISRETAEICAKTNAI